MQSVKHMKRNKKFSREADKNVEVNKIFYRNNPYYFNIVLVIRYKE